MKNKKIQSIIITGILICACVMPLVAAGGQQGGSAGSQQSTMVNGREMINNTFVTGLPIVNQPLTLNIAINLHYQDELINNFEKKPFVPIAEKATGIKINPIVHTDSTAIPAILASGDLPDAFMNLINDNLLVNNTNLFEPLDDKMEKWFPNTLKTYETYAKDYGWRRFLTLPDGHIYSMMCRFLISKPHMCDSYTFINTDWLKAVNKQIPTTVVELHDVLKTFKTQNVGPKVDPAKKLPLNFSLLPPNADIKYLSGPWGIQGNYNLNNGKISATMNTANYREYLEFVHQFFKEDLVNKEGFSQNREQFTAQLVSMNTGVFSGWGPGNFISNQADLVPWDTLPVLKVPGKENLRVVHGASQTRTNMDRAGFVISRTSKNKEAAMRWYDYLNTDQDMAMLVTHGTPGIAYRKLGENNYLQLRPTNEQMAAMGIRQLGSFYQSVGLINCHPIVLAYPTLDLENAKYSENYWRELALPKIWEFMPKESVPRALAKQDKIDERTLIEVDLLPFINAFRADALLNGVTDAKWNAYVNDLQNKYQYNKWLQWYQDFVDGKF